MISTFKITALLNNHYNGSDVRTVSIDNKSANNLIIIDATLMGSPISCLFPKRALRTLENKIFDKFNLKRQCYVDVMLRYDNDIPVL